MKNIDATIENLLQDIHRKPLIIKCSNSNIKDWKPFEVLSPSKIVSCQLCLMNFRSQLKLKKHYKKCHSTIRSEMVHDSNIA